MTHFSFCMQLESIIACNGSWSEVQNERTLFLNRLALPSLLNSAHPGPSCNIVYLSLYSLHIGVNLYFIH